MCSPLSPFVQPSLPFPLSPFYLSKGREDTSATAAKCLVVTICGATICGATIGEMIHVMIETIDGATIDSATIGEMNETADSMIDRHLTMIIGGTIDAMRCHGPLAEESACLRDRLHT